MRFNIQKTISFQPPLNMRSSLKSCHCNISTFLLIHNDWNPHFSVIEYHLKNVRNYAHESF